MFRLRRKTEKTKVLVQKTEIPILSVILFFFQCNFFFSKSHVHKRALVSFPCSLEKGKANKQSHLHHTAELLKEMKERKGGKKRKEMLDACVQNSMQRNKKRVEESDNRGQFSIASRHSIESWVKTKKNTRSFDISHGRTQQ